MGITESCWTCCMVLRASRLRRGMRVVRPISMDIVSNMCSGKTERGLMRAAAAGERTGAKTMLGASALLRVGVIVLGEADAPAGTKNGCQAARSSSVESGGVGRA